MKRTLEIRGLGANETDNDLYDKDVPVLFCGEAAVEGKGRVIQ